MSQDGRAIGQAAARRGLGRRARDVLLESDVSAFGPDGMELELDLLLRTGRVDDVIDWADPDLRPALGAGNYHWMRSQALAAAGEYAAADDELMELAGLDGGTPAVAQVAGVVAYAVGKGLLDDVAAGFGVPMM